MLFLLLTAHSLLLTLFSLRYAATIFLSSCFFHFFLLFFSSDKPESLDNSLSMGYTL
jgi:hypothetical protein